MEKILEKDIINSILDINTLQNEKDFYGIKFLNNALLYAITRTILGILKTNLALANITIPFFTIKYIKEIFIDKKIKDKRLILNRKKLIGTVKKLNLKGISISVESLLEAKIVKDTSSPINIKRIIISDGSNITILEERHLDKNKDEIYILNKKEIEKYLKERKKHSYLKELNIEKLLDKRISKYYNKFIKTIIIYLFISIYGVFNTSFKVLASNDNTEKILEYYKDDTNLTLEELNKLLTNLEVDIKDITDDDKFSLENIDSKEELDNYLLLNAIDDNPYANNKEKEVMYNFLDFFNDNLYLDKEKTYNNLLYLDFDRNYNPFSQGRNNGNSTTTIASYRNWNITYYTNPTENVIAHEVCHAAFNNKNFPKTYIEGIAKIIENEYFTEEEKDNSAYNKNVAFTKATIELIGKDKFLESISNDDINIIKEALLELNENTWPNEEKAKIEIDKIFRVLSLGLKYNEEYSTIANTLLSLANDSITDIDSFIRLHDYTDVLVSSKEDSITYYYFNEDKQKTLTFN